MTDKVPITAPVALQAAATFVAPGNAAGTAIPEHLSGRTGLNRLPGDAPGRQIGADSDREAILAWLSRCADSPNTLANSRREAERLLLWAWLECGKPLSSLTHEDLQRYRQFLADPQPADRWVSPGGTRRARHHPEWRPFAGPLSAASIGQTMTVLGALFNWLVRAGYLAGNPLTLARSGRTHAAPRITRMLDETMWDAVRAAIDQPGPDADEPLRRRQARERWLFTLLLLCGLRISEVAGNTMGCFFRRIEASTNTCQWWLDIEGKGRKRRMVPATSELMAELARYRRSVGLADVPVEGESTPLVLPFERPAEPLGGAVDSSPRPVPRALTRASIHAIVKGVFERAANLLSVGAGSDVFRANRLRAASAHWLRHTAGSRMANTMDLRYVRDTLGHISISTTSLYLHADDTLRHQAQEQGHRAGWN